MKKILVISKTNEPLKAALSDSAELQFVFAEAANALPEAYCVLAAPCNTDVETQNLFETLRRRRLPFAAVTFDGSPEHQEKLLDLGADRIFVLPMPKQLLQKYILKLGESGNPEYSEAGYDLFAYLAVANKERGAYVVNENDFSNIYRFVMRLQDRMEKKAQLVTFRFRTRLKMPIEPGTLEEALPIVQTCLRKGDIISIYGHEIVAILPGSGHEGGKIAANRIIQTYHAHCRDSIFDMEYELREIEQ